MHDSLVHILFYIFSAIAVFSAVLVISQNNPVRCVLFLVLTFIASSVLWILAQAEFLALILVLVYVGAVMTLFLFVVMMLNIDQESLKGHFIRYLPFGLILVALLTGLLMVSLPKDNFSTDKSHTSISTQTQFIESKSSNENVPTNEKRTLSNTAAIGMVLYTDFWLVFELAAVILLVAIVAAITLVHRSAQRSKQQNVVHQIMTNPKERITLINMKSE
ncbi:MAG: NADH-quinone oxidoreductase subunit J [Legionella sp.]|nr:NADH-quinone oxidoreductase subunit J [Legionella sp.]